MTKIRNPDRRAILGAVLAGAILFPACERREEVRVFTEPEGAGVYVDGVYKGRAGAEGIVVSGLEPGTHALKATMEGRQPRFVSFDAAAGKEVRAALEKTKPASLDIASDPPGAEVFRDGALAGRTPLRLEGLEPGKVSIRLESPGHKPRQEEVDLKLGEQAKRKWTLESSLAAWVAEAVAKDPKNLLAYVDLIDQLAAEGRSKEIREVSAALSRVALDPACDLKAIAAAREKLQAMVDPVKAPSRLPRFASPSAGYKENFLDLIRAQIEADLGLAMAVLERQVAFGEASHARLQAELKDPAATREEFCRGLLREVEENFVVPDSSGLQDVVASLAGLRTPEVIYFTAGRDPALLRQISEWANGGERATARNRISEIQEDFARREGSKKTADPKHYLSNWGISDAREGIYRGLAAKRRARTDAEKAAAEKKIAESIDLAVEARNTTHSLQLAAVKRRLETTRRRLDTWKKHADFLVEARLHQEYLRDDYLPW